MNPRETSETKRQPASGIGKRQGRHGLSTKGAALLVLSMLSWATVIQAQMPSSPSASLFDIQGFIQEATLDNPLDILSGGTLKVNGHVVIVPKNLIVLMPAAALTWQELFNMAPPPYGPLVTDNSRKLQTGLALADVPTPLTTYEAHVTGNRVITGLGATTSDQYIAGLISISQHALNTG